MNIHYIVGKPLYIDYNHKTFMETPKLFQKNRKGQMGGAAMAIIFAFVALAVIGVIQLIGVMITSKVSANIDQSGFTAAENATVANLKANNLDAFELGGTGQIVYAASVVILSVFGIIVMFRRG